MSKLTPTKRLELIKDGKSREVYAKAIKNYNNLSIGYTVPEGTIVQFTIFKWAPDILRLDGWVYEVYNTAVYFEVIE